MQKKTTIDGLAVRTSNRRVSGGATRTARSSAGGKVMDVARPRKRAAKKVAPQDDLPTLDGLGIAGSSFTQTSDDWSELLGEINPETGEMEEIEEIEEVGLEGSDDALGMEDEEDNAEIEDERPDRKTRKAEKKAAKKAKKQAKKAKRKHPKLLLAGKILGVLVLIAIIVFLVWGEWIIAKLTDGRSGIFDAFASLVSEGEPFMTDENGRTNVLIFGTEGYDMQGTSGNGTHDGAQLTDSIMIVSFDQETKDIAMISLPRDLKVRAACSAGKVNEVFWCNNQDGMNEEAGAQALMEQVGEIFGIDFQYRVHVNWESLVEIIDTLGGITVTLDEDVNDRNYTGMIVKAGEPTHLTGLQAVALSRARHGTTGGDFSRGNNQQKIVQGIVQKVVDDGIGVTEAFNLINILGDNLRTNFTLENIRYAMNLISGFDMNNLRQVPLVDYENNIYYVKTATIGGISYVIPQEGEGRYTQIQEYVDRMLSSNPAVREGAEIMVLNGTEASGVAGAEGDNLKAEGYNVVFVGDAALGSCMEKYCVYMLNDAMPGTREALAARYQVEVMGADMVPAGINTGTADVLVIVGQVEPEASPSL